MERPTRVMDIREERPEDVAEIRELNRRAFGQDDEGKIIDALRLNGGSLLSLVATLNGEIVGHIIYTPLLAVDQPIRGAALGPMAVLPEHQRKGIGSKLIETGNRKLKEIGYAFIVVVGHAEYYPRFGFRPASWFGMKCEWDVPDEVFMCLAFDETKMGSSVGLARYRPEFSTVA